MSDKKQENNEEYVEVSLGEFLYYSKVVRVLVVLLVIAGIIGGFVWQNIQMQKLDDKIEELAAYDSYDFETHDRAEKTSEIDSRAESLRNSEWFKNRITKNTKKADVFGYKDKSYYVLLYKDDCPYCNQIESKLYQNLEGFKKSGKKIYFCDVTTASDIATETSIKKNLLWSSDSNDKTNYTINIDEIVIYGTPTLYKVTKGSNKVQTFVGVDDIAKELDL